MQAVLGIIDPQESFCNPALDELYVPGAQDDIVRLAAFVDRVGDRFDDIVVTLDSHHLFDIAHPLFWRDGAGNPPAPFTIINAADIEEGRWIPAVPGLYAYCLEYTKKLESGKRYPLCIWKPHCLIGTPGQNVMEPLRGALRRWEERNVAYVTYVTKGSNPLTEHYSAIRAEVPDPRDPTTQVNTGLVQAFEQADRIVWAGEAKDYCLANTARDLVTEFGSDAYIKKFVLLDDATSAIDPAQGDAFVRDMVRRGMEVATTADYMK